MHSAEFGSLSGSASMGHTLEQVPQEVHFFASIFNLRKLTLLSIPYMAPKGQRALQKNLHINIQPTTVMARIDALRIKRVPAAFRRSSWASMSGKLPSSVPTGHMYLQNAGSLTPPAEAAKKGMTAGRRTTNTARRTYFRYVSHLGR